MKNLFFGLILITMTIGFISSCAKKDTTTTASTTCTSGCTAIAAGPTATGAITVGFGPLSGTYVSSCFTGSSIDSMASSGSVPSDTKSIAWAFVVTGNDNVTDEYQGFSDATCTTKTFQFSWNYDNVSVGNADSSSGKYQVSLPLTSIKLLVNSTAAETWLETMYSNLIDLTIGADYTFTQVVQYYGLWNLSGTTFKQADAESSVYPTVLDDIDYIKK